MIKALNASALATLVYLSPAVGFADTSTFPLTALDGTSAHSVIAEPVSYQGADGLHLTVSPDHKSIEEGGCDNCTFLALDGIDFSNGTIELEVAGKPQQGAPAWARGFVGIIFRADLEADTYEGVYLRPMNAHAETQIQRNHTVQYFSYPDHPWHLLREQSPGHYESYAPVEVGQWTHMRVEVDGETMHLYLNHAETPALVVTDLKHGADLRGTIGLFTEPATDAYFRNLVVTPRESGFITESAEPMSEAEAWALVKPFYDLFSLQGSEEQARAAFSPDWKSYFSNDGFRELDQTMAFVTENWPAMLPDSTWVQDDIAVTNDNEIIVRGTLSGTPAGDTFFGAPVTGKSISIMTLDMHKVVGGQVVETHHIEDWVRAVQQLGE